MLVVEEVLSGRLISLIGGLNPLSIFVFDGKF
jgi:hypothetical protein